MGKGDFLPGISFARTELWSSNSEPEGSISPPFCIPFLWLYLFVLSPLSFLVELSASSFFLFFLLFLFMPSKTPLADRGDNPTETSFFFIFRLVQKRSRRGGERNHLALKPLESCSCCFWEWQGSLIWPCTQGRRARAL